MINFSIRRHPSHKCSLSSERVCGPACSHPSPSLAFVILFQAASTPSCMYERETRSCSCYFSRRHHRPALKSKHARETHRVLLVPKNKTYTATAPLYKLIPSVQQTDESICSFLGKPSAARALSKNTSPIVLKISPLLVNLRGEAPGRARKYAHTINCQ
jgi:hypothetical protein